MYTSRRCCSFVSRPVQICDFDEEDEEKEEDNPSSFIARLKRKCLRAEAARDEVVDRLPPVHRSARKANDCGKD